MTEIEIKAHVYEPEETARRVGAFASFTGETVKRDAYWSRAEIPGICPPRKVRIREEDGTLTVTYKRKEIRGETEVNNESEFTIDNRESFEAFISDVGFSPSNVKEKRTRRWTCSMPIDARQAGETREIGIELSLVANLGWFLELEALIETPDDKMIDGVRHALLELLARCGIPETALESRYYTEMLADRA